MNEGTERSDHVGIETDKVDIHTNNMTIVNEGGVYQETNDGSTERHDEKPHEEVAADRPPEAGARPGETAPQSHDERAPRQPVPGREPANPLAELSRREAGIPEPRHDVVDDAHRENDDFDYGSMHDREQRDGLDDQGRVLGASTPQVLEHVDRPPLDDAGEKQIADDNRSALQRSFVPERTPGEAMPVDADAGPVDPVPQPSTNADYAGIPGSVVGRRTVEPRHGESVVHTEIDSRMGSRTVGATGGRGTEIVRDPGVSGGAQMLGGAAVRVVNAGRAMRSNALAIPRPHVPASSVESTSPVHPLTAKEGSAVINAGGEIVRDGDPIPRMTSTLRVDAIVPNSPTLRAHLVGDHVDNSRHLPRDMADAQARGMHVGTASLDDLADASREVAERARTSDVIERRDAHIAEHNVDVAEITARRLDAEQDLAPVVQSVQAGNGLQIEQPLHAPNRRAPIAPHMVVDHAETENAWVENDCGERVFVGTQGTPAAPAAVDPMNRDWIHAPNLEADMNAPRFEVRHAPEISNDEGGF